MNILHLYTDLNITCGISKTIFNIINGSKNEINHYVVCYGGNRVKNFSDNQISIKIIERRKFLPITFFTILKICKINRIDIVHSHHRIFDLFAFYLKLFLDIKTVTSVQSKVYGKKRLSYKADYLIAVSDTIRKHLINYFAKDDKKIFLINNFVSQKEFEFDGKSANFNDGDNSKTICFIGRFSKEKGVDILLKAFSEIKERINSVKLLLVGTGELLEEMTKYIQTNKLNVEIFSPQLNIVSFYKSADIIVLPSRVDPFPLTMVEAGLMKIPFVGSNVDGIAEFIEHGVNGSLCLPENVADLIDILMDNLTDYQNAQLRAEKLYQKVIVDFTEEKIIPKYISLYKFIHEN